MRQALRQIADVPDHLGLAYDAWAPVGAGGKVPDNDRAGWLSKLANLAVSSDYALAFKRWKSSFDAPGDRLVEVTLSSRLLLGHGNASATDVGLTVHHTWGVPVIPGSALKGLLAHYVDAVYGPADPSLPPWEQPDGERDRARYQGVTWHGRRIRRGPGEVFRALFGAPDADEDRVLREREIEAGATAGCAAFHDALYVPGSGDGDHPFVTDVLTVHQKPYYDSSGEESWPSDYASPNPVSFLTVRPKVRLLLALSGPADWTELAEKLLLDALREWGIGGKTSSGYGRLRPADEAAKRPPPTTSSRTAPVAPGPKHVRGEKITVTRVEDPKGKVKFRAPDGLLGHFAGENPPQVGIGETTQVWVANVNPQGYTLTLRQRTKKDKMR